jgi:hypothetical protein
MPRHFFAGPGAFEPEAIAVMGAANSLTTPWRSKSLPDALLQRQDLVSVIRFVC